MKVRYNKGLECCIEIYDKQLAVMTTLEDAIALVNGLNAAIAEAKKEGIKTSEGKHCGDCGYFMRYAGKSEHTGDCCNTTINKECGEYHNGEVGLQVSDDELPCTLFRLKPTRHVLNYIKAHPQWYKQKEE